MKIQEKQIQIMKSVIRLIPNKQAYSIQYLSYFYTIKIAKLYEISILILVSILIGNPPIGKPVHALKTASHLPQTRFVHLTSQNVILGIRNKIKDIGLLYNCTSQVCTFAQRVCLGSFWQTMSLIFSFNSHFIYCRQNLDS